MKVKHKQLFSIVYLFISIAKLLRGQTGTIITESNIVLNSNSALLKLILTSAFVLPTNSKSFDMQFSWDKLNYSFLTAEGLIITDPCQALSINTNSNLYCTYLQNKVILKFYSPDISLESGIYSVSIKFLNFKNPYSARAFPVFTAYIENNSKSLTINNISTQELTQELTRKDPIYIRDTYFIDSTPELQITFTAQVAIDKYISVVQINIGKQKTYRLQQINNDDGAVININDGVYILPNIFKYFTTSYYQSKNVNFNIRMAGFDYSQQVQFDLSIVENIQTPLYPKMETVKYIFDIKPLKIISNAVIIIPNTSSNLVGDNSIYWIDFTLSKGFQQNFGIQIKFDSSIIKINDVSDTKLFDKTNLSYVQIETSASLDTMNSIILLTHKNYVSTASLDKKILRLQLNVQNPLSIKSKLSFIIQTVSSLDTTRIYEKLDGNLNVILQPNSLKDLQFEPLNPTVGQLSSYRVKFAVKTIIPKGGQIKIIFPPDIGFPFYKVGGTSQGSLNTVEPTSINISTSSAFELEQFPCLVTGCIAYIKNGITTNVQQDSIIEFKLNFIRNVFSTRPVSVTISTLDQNLDLIDTGDTQFAMTIPNKFNYVQINKETAIVGLPSYYEFNIQFNTTHYDGYLLFVTYPQEIQPIVQNVNDLNCIGLDTPNGLIPDLREKDESCFVRNVDGVNKIQIKLKFKNPDSPSRTISLRISSFLNYYLSNKDFYFGLETVIRESLSDNKYNIFYIEKLVNDQTLKVQMSANQFSALSITSTPGIMDQENEIIINLSPNTIPKSPTSDSQTFYIRIQLSSLLNVNTNVCSNYLVPPSNTKFDQCVYQSNTYQIPFTILRSGSMKFVLKKVNYPYNRNSVAQLTIMTYQADTISSTAYPLDLQTATVPLSCSGECKTCNPSSLSSCLSCYEGFYLDSDQCLSSCGSFKYPVLDGVWKCQLCKNNCNTCQLDISGNYQCLTCKTSFVKISDQACGDKCLPGTFKNTANPPVCEACNSNCYECADTSIKCTSCNSSSTYKYLINNKCVDICPTGTYQNNLLGKCSDCHSNCTKCTEYTVCQECKLEYKYLVNNFCYDNCPNTTVKNEFDKCVPCTNNCLTCKLTTDTCVSCKSGFYLVGTSCSDKCQIGQVVVSGQCVSCASPCELCQNTVSSCTKCVQGKYLTGDSCVSQEDCPLGTYGDNSTRQCVKCINNCFTCQGESICKSCNPTSIYNKFYNGQCLQTCPSSAYFDSSTNKCIQCQQQCLTCNSSSCLECDLNSNFPIFSNGQCLAKCPSDKPILTSNGCVACSSKCMLCENSPEYCSKCSSDLFLYQGECLSNCPSGLIQVAGTCEQEYNEQSSLFPLPFFISSVIVSMIMGFYFYWNRDMLYSSNLIGIISILELGAWAFYILILMQFRNDYSEEKYNLMKSFYAFLLGILCYVLINIIFFVYFCVAIYPDTRFKVWGAQKCNKHVHRIFSFFGLILSFKINRLLYGRLCNLSYLSAEFNDNAKIFKPVNIFSVFSLLLHNGPIFVSACLTINEISASQKSHQLYLNGIEVILMNILMIILIILDFHKPDDYFDKNRIQKQNTRVHADDSGYGMMGFNEKQIIDLRNMVESYSQIQKLKNPSSLDQSMLNSSNYMNGSSSPKGGSNSFKKQQNMRKLYDKDGKIIHEEEDIDAQDYVEEIKNNKGLQKQNSEIYNQQNENNQSYLAKSQLIEDSKDSQNKENEGISSDIQDSKGILNKKDHSQNNSEQLKNQNQKSEKLKKKQGLNQIDSSQNHQNNDKQLEQNKILLDQNNLKNGSQINSQKSIQNNQEINKNKFQNSQFIKNNQSDYNEQINSSNKSSATIKKNNEGEEKLLNRKNNHKNLIGQERNESQASLERNQQQNSDRKIKKNASIQSSTLNLKNNRSSSKKDQLRYQNSQNDIGSEQENKKLQKNKSKLNNKSNSNIKTKQKSDYPSSSSSLYLQKDTESIDSQQKDIINDHDNTKNKSNSNLQNQNKQEGYKSDQNKEELNNNRDNQQNNMQNENDSKNDQQKKGNQNKINKRLKKYSNDKNNDSCAEMNQDKNHNIEGEDSSQKIDGVQRNLTNVNESKKQSQNNQLNKKSHQNINELVGKQLQNDNQSQGQFFIIDSQNEEKNKQQKEYNNKDQIKEEDQNNIQNKEQQNNSLQNKDSLDNQIQNNNNKQNNVSNKYSQDILQQQKLQGKDKNNIQSSEINNQASKLKDKTSQPLDLNQINKNKLNEQPTQNNNNNNYSNDSIENSKQQDESQEESDQNTQDNKNGQDKQDINNYQLKGQNNQYDIYKNNSDIQSEQQELRDKVNNIKQKVNNIQKNTQSIYNPELNGNNQTYYVKNNGKKRKAKRGIECEDEGDYFTESQGSVIQDTPSNYNEQNMRFAINQGIIEGYMKMENASQIDGVEVPIPASIQNTQDSQETEKQTKYSMNNYNLAKNNLNNSNYNNKDTLRMNQTDKIYSSSQKNANEQFHKRFNGNQKVIFKGDNSVELNEKGDLYNGYNTIDISQFSRNNKDLQQIQNTQPTQNSVHKVQNQLNQIDPRSLSPNQVRNIQSSNLQHGNNSNLSGEKTRHNISPSMNGQFIKVNYNEKELDEIVDRKNFNSKGIQQNNSFLKSHLVSPSSALGGGGFGSTRSNKNQQVRKNISKSTKRGSKQFYGQMEFANNSVDEEQNKNSISNPYEIHFPAVDNNNQEFSDFNSIEIGDQYGQNSQYNQDSFKLPSLPKATSNKLADLERIYLQRLECFPKNKQTINQGQTRHKSTQKRRNDNKSNLNHQDSMTASIQENKYDF